MTNCVYEISLLITDGMTTSPMQVCGWAIGMNDVSIAGEIREWLMAIGAILVVAVAVFSEWIKSLFLVSVDVLISPRCPHFMIEGSSGADMVPVADDFTGKVWVEVANCSRWKNASFVRLSVERIYVRASIEETKCYDKVYEMHPRNLTWSGLASPKNAMAHISPLTSEYARLLSIQLPDATIGNIVEEGDDPPAQVPAPILYVECEHQRYPIAGNFQDIIVCARLTGKAVKTDMVYLQVVWQGKTMKQLKEGADKFLKCKRLSEKKFASLRKDA